mmetsp:Transcript_9898/g.28147  ORF Transcript_9898/g.28147 Transcript_9898/m.28147 type:complete len:250 (+) Transcript_9898:1198-1947(+)
MAVSGVRPLYRRLERAISYTMEVGGAGRRVARPARAGLRVSLASRLLLRLLLLRRVRMAPGGAAPPVHLAPRPLLVLLVPPRLHPPQLRVACRVIAQGDHRLHGWLGRHLPGSRLERAGLRGGQGGCGTGRALARQPPDAQQRGVVGSRGGLCSPGSGSRGGCGRRRRSAQGGGAVLVCDRRADGRAVHGSGRRDRDGGLGRGVVGDESVPAHSSQASLSARVPMNANIFRSHGRAALCSSALRPPGGR